MKNGLNFVIIPKNIPFFVRKPDVIEKKTDCIFEISAEKYIKVSYQISNNFFEVFVLQTRVIRVIMIITCNIYKK